MPNLVHISENQLLNAPNINLFSDFAMFNESFTWNVVSGTATAINVDSLQLEGDRCLRIVPTPTTTALVNSGGSQMIVTVPYDGSYIFTIKHRAEYSDLTTMTINVKVYVNGTPSDYTFTGDADNNNLWRTYYQVIPNLVSGDEIDFAFEFEENDIAGTYKNYFDAFKFEFDAFGLGIPTVFSLPQTRTQNIGVYDYADLATQSSPVSLTANTWAHLVNDTDGVDTNITYELEGIDIYDGISGEFDFSSLELGDTVGIRLDIYGTTTGANQSFFVDLVLGYGDAGEYRIPFVTEKTFKSSGNHRIAIYNEIYIGNTITKDNPARFEVKTDNTGSYKTNGWFVKVSKRLV